MGKTTDLKAVAALHGECEIELPGWDEEAPFVCRVRPLRLDTMVLMGYIPNPLIETVRRMFFAPPAQMGEIAPKEQYEALTAMAKYMLVKPSYAQVRAAGLELTGEQLLTLYAYAIGGAAVLEPFRRLLRGGVGGDGAAVPDAAQQPAGA